jgi:hypothetical protein
VTTRDDDQLGAGNAPGQQPTIRRRHHPVVGTTDGERGRSDRSEKRDTRPRGGSQDVPQRTHRVRLRPVSSRRRPTQGIQRPLVARSCPKATRRRHQNQATKAIGRVNSELLGDVTTVGVPQHVGGVHADLVEHRDRESSQRRYRQRVKRRGAAAHARRVEGDDRMTAQRPRDRRPALQGPQETIEQQQGGPVALNADSYSQPTDPDQLGVEGPRSRSAHAFART